MERGTHNTHKNALKLGEVHNVMKIAIPLHYSL